jgi:ABC-type multidrug transport system permease subunit
VNGNEVHIFLRGLARSLALAFAIGMCVSINVAAAEEADVRFVGCLIKTPA